MRSSELLVDALGRTAENVAAVLEGLGPAELEHRPGPRANTIGWLVWHLTRVQDDHVAHVAGHEQVWTADGWADRFALPLDVRDIGFGHTPDEVAQVRADGDLLLGYHRAVHERSVAWVAGLGDDDLDRVVDERWDPPVTLGVRLVSVADDCAQHVGQAAYLRGLLSR